MDATAFAVPQAFGAAAPVELRQPPSAWTPLVSSNAPNLSPATTSASSSRAVGSAAGGSSSSELLVRSGGVLAGLLVAGALRHGRNKSGGSKGGIRGSSSTFGRADLRRGRWLRCGGQSGGSERTAPDAESLRWQLELAVRNQNLDEAASLRDAIKEAESLQPTSMLRALAQEKVQAAAERAIADEVSIALRLRAVDELRNLATAPGNVSEAEDALYRVLRESPNGRVVEHAEGSLWSAWLKSGDEDVDYIMSRGLKLLNNGDLDRAIQAFTEVVTYAPNFAEGWNKRATAFFMAERYDEAIEDCHKVLALKPRHFGCLSGLGVCYLRKNDERLALKWFKEVIAVHPFSSETRRIVANLDNKGKRAIIGRLMSRLQEVEKELSEEEEGGFADIEQWFSSFGLNLKGQKKVGEAEEPPPMVEADWDVHRVVDVQEHTYFIRVRVRHLGHKPVRCQAEARFYSLKCEGGSVFPLHRLTPCASSGGFELQPGDSFSYSFMLTLSKELLAAQGGIIFSCEGDIQEASLPRLSISNAFGGVKGLREDDLDRINDGHQFLGRLEIQV
eukprot:TRINITY_DN19986_c0_g1_i1.p1 TRINITY_DN19986_c0_g1~~TRINITY_DN19986_c0_g1_i1.p1  ORF type:complete len:561 (+),score=174.69 TRINITY_DN19986_c0_g1_i1:66-1748(+)